MSHEFRVYQHVPIPKNLAPYVRMVCDRASATLNSCYRGQDAEALLNKYGHSSQAQLYYGWEHRLPGYNPANPPGRSTHEQKSDGVAYPNVPAYHGLAWWQIGFDVNDSDVERCIAAAKVYHWQLFRPYPSGSEYHHLNFRVEPKPHSRATDLRIRFLRARMPRS